MGGDGKGSYSSCIILHFIVLDTEAVLSDFKGMTAFNEHIAGLDGHLRAIFTEPGMLDRQDAAVWAYLMQIKHEFDKLKEVIRQNETENHCNNIC